MQISQKIMNAGKRIRSSILTEASNREMVRITNMLYPTIKSSHVQMLITAAENGLARPALMIIMTMQKMTDPAFLCTQMPIPLHPGAERYFTEIGVLP